MRHWIRVNINDTVAISQDPGGLAILWSE